MGPVCVQRGFVMSWWPDAPASDLLSNPRLVVPVVGAGLSAAAGLPGSIELAEHLVTAGGLPAPAGGWPENLFVVADAVYGAPQASREVLNQAIASRLDLANNPGVGPTGTHRALARTPSKLIITFNYDLLIEEAARQQGIDYLSITHRDSEVLIEHLRARRRRQLLIYHIHGSITEPGSIVIDDASYRAISNDLRVIRSLEYVADFTSLCFLGSRLDEPYIQATLLRLPSGQPRHVLVTDDVTAAELTTQRAALIPSRYGIVTTSFATGRWELLEQFTDRLVEPRQVSTAPRAATARRPYRTFIEPKVRLVNGNSSTEIWSLVSSLFTAPENLGLWDVSRTRRALVVGGAGIGKTSLLYRLAEFSDELENPVLVALPRVAHLRGTPGTLLAEWLSDKAAAPSSVRNRESGRLMVILDGFDEIDHHLQGQAAETIAALADAFPQHRFIVGSRRVPALAVLTGQGFTEFEVETDRRWAEAFLSSQGKSLDWLKETLPEVSLLGPLSTNPFVLTVLCRLAHRTVPPDRLDFPRVFAFMDHLVRHMVDREANRLAYSPELLHTVVRELAAMQRLLGLKSVDIRTVRGDRDALALFGPESRADVLHDVARRCLIWTDGDEYSFAEPLLCDHLTAAYLLARDPDASAFTDAIAPQFSLRREFSFPDRPSQRIDVDMPRAVRSDLVGVAGVLASRSGEWARWLRSVDPALAAVSLSPQDQAFPASERADLLWQGMSGKAENPDGGAGDAAISTAFALKKSNEQWIPGRMPALQALLQSGDAEATTESIYRSLHSDSAPASLRAKAAEALTFSTALGEPEIAEMLETGPTMLVRALAKVARRRKLCGLTPVIAKRLLASEAGSFFGDSVLDEIYNLSVEAGNAGALISTMWEIPPTSENPAYWRLFGIARMTAKPDELVGLSVLALKYRTEFLHYFSARPNVAAALGLQLVDASNAGAIMLSESHAQQMITFFQAMDADSPGARQVAEVLKPESERERPASKEPSGPPGAAPADTSVPVLFPRLELSSLIHSMVYTVAMNETVDYASWIPPEAVRRRETLLEHTASDPLAAVESRLAAASGRPATQWREWLPSVLPPGQQLEALPLAMRAAIGARVEAAIEVVRPGGPESAERLKFLRKYGPVLRLEPSPSEWVALAKTRSGTIDNWLRVTAPSADFIKQAFSGATPKEVRNLVSAIPAGARGWFAGDAADALAANSPLTDKELAAVAREFADAGNLNAIRLLVERFPDRLAAFAGWTAACGDSSHLGFLLEQMVSEAKQPVFAEYLSWRLGWAEPAAAQELEWPKETPRALAIVILQATARFLADRQYKAIVSAIGTLLCSVDPANTVAYCQLFGVVSKWPQLKEPFKSLFKLAIDRARVAQGTTTARQLLDVTELRGNRNIVLYEPKL